MMDNSELTPGFGGARSTLLALPDGLGEIIEFYGAPDADGDLKPDPGWEQRNIVGMRLPFPMRLSWGTHQVINWVRVHKKCSEAMMGALEAFRDAVGADIIESNAWDRFGGLYHVRMKGGSKTEYSMHAWGAALDINPHLGAMGEVPAQPTELVDAFELSGSEWGGDWPTIYPGAPFDGMHWQYATGY